MTRRIVLLLTFSLALALWARRRTKVEVAEGDGVQPVDPWLYSTINGGTTNVTGLTISSTATIRPGDSWTWTA